jgi:hypothetical protein
VNKIEEIFKAWVSSANPNKDVEELAKQRVKICTSCEYKDEVIQNKKWSFYCTKCTCPINKKIFSPKHNACPENKWEDIDSGYEFLYKDKIKKSVI